jgi:hypothetical protein
MSGSAASSRHPGKVILAVLIDCTNDSSRLGSPRHSRLSRFSKVHPRDPCVTRASVRTMLEDQSGVAAQHRASACRKGGGSRSRPAMTNLCAAILEGAHRTCSCARRPPPDLPASAEENTFLLPGWKRHWRAALRASSSSPCFESRERMTRDSLEPFASVCFRPCCVLRFHLTGHRLAVDADVRLPFSG